MNIGILSDTHDHFAQMPRVLDLFSQHKIDVILHAGDIVSAPILFTFKPLAPIQFIGVFGNCDIDRPALQKVAAELGGKIYPKTFSGTLAGRKIFMTHSPSGITNDVLNDSYDLIIYGHTHRLDTRQSGKTHLINPGETSTRKTGLGHVIIMDLTDMSFIVEDIR